MSELQQFWGDQFIPNVSPYFTGSILGMSVGTPPSGFFECDGSVISTITYPELYAVIGDRYNIGGEIADTFRLPDYRNRFIRGVADSTISSDPDRNLRTNFAGSVVGNAVGSYQGQEIESHNHYIWYDGNTTTGVNSLSDSNAWAEYTTFWSTEGSSDGTQPKSKTVMFIIKY